PTSPAPTTAAAPRQGPPAATPAPPRDPPTRAHPPRDRCPLARLRRCLHATPLPTLRPAALRRHPDHRLPPHPQLAAHPRRPRPRPSLQLPRGLPAPPLLAVAPGARLGRLHPAPLAPDRHRGRRRRRYRCRAQGQEGLRQGLPSRCRALDPCLYGLS